MRFCNLLIAAAAVAVAAAMVYLMSLVLVLMPLMVSYMACWFGILVAQDRQQCYDGLVLGLRFLFRCDITSMSQRGVRRIFEDDLALAMITPRLSGSTGLVPTTPSPLVYITAFSTQCASATPRVDVDAVMTGLGESLWLENTESHGGRKEKEEEEGKESSKEKKDPGCIPVFIRSLTGRTLKLLMSPHDDVLTLLTMVEGLVHIPRQALAGPFHATWAFA